MVESAALDSTGFFGSLVLVAFVVGFVASDLVLRCVAEFVVALLRSVETVL